jgi:predicted negative regulator of RcsB-dependent stress response
VDNAPVVVRWKFQNSPEVFVARITRKELKTDKFALEVEHTVTFFEEHQKELIRYGAVALAAVVLLIGYTMYAHRQHSKREEALYRAIQIQETTVGIPAPGVTHSFPTQEVKDQVALKAFGDLQAAYPGTAEGEIAGYYLGAIKADQGKLAEAEKDFKTVADKADEKYASLAKMSLAQLYFGDGRTEQGEALLRDLIANPTPFVSKEQATIVLARFLAPKKPAEAKKLLEPMRTIPGTIGQAAISALAELQ